MNEEQMSRWLESLPDVKEQKDQEWDRLLEHAYAAYQNLCSTVDMAVIRRMLDLNRELDSPWKDAELTAAMISPVHVEPCPKQHGELRLLLAKSGILLLPSGNPNVVTGPYLSYDSTLEMFREEITESVERTEDIRGLERLFIQTSQAYLALVQTFYKELEAIAGKPDPEGRECLCLREKAEQESASRDSQKVQESLQQTFHSYKNLVDGLPEQQKLMRTVLDALNDCGLLHDFYQMVDNYPRNHLKIRETPDHSIRILYDGYASSDTRYYGDVFLMQFQKPGELMEKVTLSFPYNVTTPAEFARQLSINGASDVAENPEFLDALNTRFLLMEDELDTVERVFPKAMEVLLGSYQMEPEAEEEQDRD
jgi:hypothetical protein